MGLGISDAVCAKLFALISVRLLGDPPGEQTPQETWFQDRRTRGGLEATAFAWTRVLAAKHICQLGYDETKIERKSHLDIWVTLRAPGPDGELQEVERVVLTAGTILIDETAAGISQTIIKVFDRGAEILRQLRTIARGTLDAVIPEDVKGDALFLKVRSVMHDTCNTANLTVRKLRELKEEKGKALHGDEAWGATNKNDRELLDSRCLNHGRNLQTTVFLAAPPLVLSAPRRYAPQVSLLSSPPHVCCSAADVPGV